jgi:hypothetical protein
LRSCQSLSKSLQVSSVTSNARIGRCVWTQNAASTSQMGRFETEMLTQEANLSALADLSRRWIDRLNARRS